MPIVLTVPERARVAAAFDTSARAQLAWVRELPLARPLEAATALAERLHLLNTTRIDAEARLDILGAFRGVSVVLLEELEHVYAKAAPVHASRGREHLSVARALSSELSTGYRMAIVERRSRLLARLVKRDARALVFRALEHAAAVLDASFRAYAPVPPDAWRQLHELYLYAEQEDVLGEVADLETGRSVRDLYVRTLLVALADPYRLVRGELDRYLEAAGFALGAATLVAAAPVPSRGTAQFIVPCDTDKPPKPALSANDDGGGPNARLLDAGAVVEKLRARQAALEAGNVSSALRKAAGADAAAILGRLAVLWGDPPKRAQRRDAADTTVAVCVGLKTLWHFVATDDGREDEGGVRRGITMPLRAQPEAGEHPVFEWEVVNQSSGGLKVRRNQPQQALAVGDLVGVKMIGRPGWIVAVARWITTHDDGAMEFGIQFLATGARAVWFEPTIAAVPGTRQALWTQDEAAGAAMITPPDTFADLREFEVSANDDPWRVRATHLAEKTARFEQFQVAPS